MNYINSCIKTIQLYYEVDFVINAALNSDWVRISLYVSLGSHRYGTLEGNLAYMPVMDPRFGSWHFTCVKICVHYLIFIFVPQSGKNFVYAQCLRFEKRCQVRDLFKMALQSFRLPRASCFCSFDYKWRM
jgi:hypothetical protein